MIKLGMVNINFTTNQSLWGARGGAQGSRWSANWKNNFSASDPPPCGLKGGLFRGSDK